MNIWQKSVEKNQTHYNFFCTSVLSSSLLGITVLNILLSHFSFYTFCRWHFRVYSSERTHIAHLSPIRCRNTSYLIPAVYLVFTLASCSFPRVAFFPSCILRLLPPPLHPCFFIYIVFRKPLTSQSVTILSNCRTSFSLLFYRSVSPSGVYIYFIYSSHWQ